MAWVDGHLWGAFHYSYPVEHKGMIIKFDMDGNIVESFKAPGSDTENAAYTSGLAFDGEFLWNLNYSDDKIYKLTTSGEVVSSFDVLNGGSTLAWDGESLWVSNVINYRIYKVDPKTGEIQHTIKSPKWENDREAQGIAFDGSHLWVSNVLGLFKIAPESGEIIEEFNSIGSRKDDGLTWDGEYLWAGGVSTSAVKKFDVGAAANAPVANAGNDQTVFDEVILDASQSDDADGSIVSYQWQLNHKENSFDSTTAEGMTPTVSNLKEGFYEVTLTVTDNDGKTGTDTMLLGVCGIWDVNDDNNLGLSEVIYILQVLSGIR